MRQIIAIAVALIVAVVLYRIVFHRHHHASLAEAKAGGEPSGAVSELFSLQSGAALRLQERVNSQSPKASQFENLEMPAVRRPALESPGDDEALLGAKRQMAGAEFAAKNYSAAESIYREILPRTFRKPLETYHIFACLLLEGRRTEAENLLSRIPSPPNDNSPAWYYASATRLFVEGKPDQAREWIAKARAEYPKLCPYYDPTLRQLGFE
jgi:tetratricopeptide (TPR) repeat protein